MTSLVRVLAALLFVGLGAVGQAQASLQITPITWDVIGLDSNRPTDGPDTFPVGARVCNVGTADATGVVATFSYTGPRNLYLALRGATTIALGTLPPGAPPAHPNALGGVPANCADAYFNVQVQRSKAAFGARQGYRIEATGTGLATVGTPPYRELYVEKLISQGRNAILSFTGPTDVVVGGTYTYTLRAKTATQGYEQLEHYPDFPNTVFRIVDVRTTYTAPPGAVNSTVYADACGWVDDPADPDYFARQSSDPCVRADRYAGGKAGGVMDTTYTVQILSAGTATVSNVIYDFSGSSFHYNADYGTPISSLTVTARNPPRATKAFAPATILAGATSLLEITVHNDNPGLMTGVDLTDVYPPGLVNAAAPAPGGTCGGAVTALPGGDRVRLVGGTVPANGSCVVRVTVTAPAAGSYENVLPAGAVSSARAGASTVEARATLTALANADLRLAKSADTPVPVRGEPFAFTLTVVNDGPDRAENVSVDDALPSGLVFLDSADGCLSADGVLVSCPVGALDPGSSLALTFRVAFDTDAAGAPLLAFGAVATNTAEITASSLPDPDSTPANGAAGEDDQASATVTVSGLELGKGVCNAAASPCAAAADFTAVASGVPGEVLVYRLPYANHAAAITDLRITDPLPAEVALVQDAYAGATEAWLSCPDGSTVGLELGAVATVDVDVSAACGGTVPADTSGWVEFRVRIR